VNCEDPETIRRTMKRVAAALRDNDIAYALAGSMAVWARGGTTVRHDVDFIIMPKDKDRSLAVMDEIGMRTERPAEEWLYKAYGDDCLVDLIFRPPSGETAVYIENAEDLVVDSLHMPVMRVDDVLIMKLGALTERYLDFGAALEIARATREQISWDRVERETKGSPFAEAFFVMCDGLGIREKTVSITSEAALRSLPS
jgi:hypothetical protein